MSISLARGLTASALVEYLKADAKLEPLATCLADDSVNGDVLIDAIKLQKSASPAALKDYLPAEVEKQSKKERKADLTDERRAKLLKRMEEEHASSISSEAGGLIFCAMAASAEARVEEKTKAKRAVIEKDGTEYKMKVPLEVQIFKAQPQFKHYLENQEELLAKIDGTLLSSTDVKEKNKKKGGPAKLVRLQRIHVSGAFLTKTFREGEEEHEELLINSTEGPYTQPYFMKIICAERTKAEKQSNKRAAKTSSDTLKEEAAEAVGKVTAKKAKLVASAHRTLMAQVSKKETLPKEASEAERARVEEAVRAARIIKDNEESKLEAAVEDEAKKWEQLVEVREAVEAKIAMLTKDAADKKQAATTRAADLVDQAQRRVQLEQIARASKGRQTTVETTTDETVGAGSGDLAILERDAAEKAAAPAPVPAVAEPAPAPVSAASATPFAAAAANLFANL